MRRAEVASRQMTEQEQKDLGEGIGEPKGKWPRTVNEKVAAAKCEATAAKQAATAEPSAPETPAEAKAEPMPGPPKPAAEEQRATLQQTADAICRATRLKDCEAIISSGSGRAARIVIPGDGDK